MHSDKMALGPSIGLVRSRLDPELAEAMQQSSMRGRVPFYILAGDPPQPPGRSGVGDSCCRHAGAGRHSSPVILSIPGHSALQHLAEVCFFVTVEARVKLGRGWLMVWQVRVVVVEEEGGWRASQGRRLRESAMFPSVPWTQSISPVSNSNVAFGQQISHTNAHRSPFAKSRASRAVIMSRVAVMAIVLFCPGFPPSSRRCHLCSPYPPS